MVKPFIAILSLGLGAGAAAGLVAMQMDPAFLTSPVQQSTVPLAAYIAARPLAPTTASDVEPSASHVVLIKEVTVYGARAARHVLRPATRPPVTRAAMVQASPASQSGVTVVPAPCVDGQYRQLDPHRGVRLMCFSHVAQ